MRICFFGQLSDQLGEYIECDVAKSLSIADLRSELAGRFPDAADRLQSRTVRACVADEIVSEDFIVEPGQSVEFWPPVSGG